MLGVVGATGSPRGAVGRPHREGRREGDDADGTGDGEDAATDVAVTLGDGLGLLHWITHLSAEAVRGVP